MRIALTQGEGRLERLAADLSARGFEVLRIPLIETSPRLTPVVRARARALLDCPWMLFTSRSGVEAWQALELPFHGPLIGAVGNKTTSALRTAGAEVRLIGKPQTAEGLAQSFLGNPDASGPVGLPRGNRALITLQRLLEEAGVEVKPVIVYDTTTRRWQHEQGEVDVVVLASPSATEALPQKVGERAVVVALGPSTCAAASARGFTAQQATAPTATAVLNVIERLVRS